MFYLVSRNNQRTAEGHLTPKHKMALGGDAALVALFMGLGFTLFLGSHTQMLAGKLDKFFNTLSQHKWMAYTAMGVAMAPAAGITLIDLLAWFRLRPGANPNATMTEIAQEAVTEVVENAQEAVTEVVERVQVKMGAKKHPTVNPPTLLNTKDTRGVGKQIHASSQSVDNDPKTTKKLTERVQELSEHSGAKGLEEDSKRVGKKTREQLEAKRLSKKTIVDK